MIKRILIIDDDEDILNILSETFTAEGLETKAVTNTDDINDLIRNFQPDVILLDYLLNGINGGELCSQIKKNPAISHIPVALISAYPKVLLSLGTYHSNAIITKPFDINQLMRQINLLTA